MSNNSVSTHKVSTYTDKYMNMLKQYICFYSMQQFKELYKDNMANASDRFAWSKVFNQIEETIKLYIIELDRFRRVPERFDTPITVFPIWNTYEEYTQYLCEPYGRPSYLVGSQHSYETTRQRWQNENITNWAKNHFIHLITLRLRIDGYITDDNESEISSEEKTEYENDIGYCFDAMTYYTELASKQKTVSDIVKPNWDDYELRNIDESQYFFHERMVMYEFERIKVQYYEDLTLWRIKQFIGI